MPAATKAIVFDAPAVVRLSCQPVIGIGRAMARKTPPADFELRAFSVESTSIYFGVQDGVPDRMVSIYFFGMLDRPVVAALSAELNVMSQAAGLQKGQAIGKSQGVWRLTYALREEQFELVWSAAVAGKIGRIEVVTRRLQGGRGQIHSLGFSSPQRDDQAQ